MRAKHIRVVLPAACLFAALPFLSANAAIVLLDDSGSPDSVDAAGSLDDQLISIPESMFGFQDAVEEFQREGIGELGWEYREGLKQLESWVDQARAAFDAGEFDQARIRLERANDKQPGHPGIEFALADTLFQLKRYQDALEWVGEARAHGIRRAIGYWYEAKCFEALGDPEQAIRSYEEVIETDDPKLGPRAFAAVLRLRTRPDVSFAEAEAALGDMLDRPADPAPILQALVALSLRAKAYEKSGTYAEKLVAAAPEKPAGYLGAIHAAHAVDPDGAAARKKIIEFIKRFPARTEGYLFLANALIRNSQAEQALKLLHAARPKVEQPRPIQLALAQAHYALGQWEEGVKLNIRLLRADPTEALLWRKYLGALDRHFAGKAAANLPRFTNDQGGGKKHVAEAHRVGKEQNYALAVRHLIRALYAGEQSAGVFNDLGCLVVPQLGPDAAEPFFRMALIAVPNYREAANNLRAIRTQRDEAERIHAIARLEKELSEGAGSPELENELGELLAMEGRTNDAGDHFELAVNLDPQFARAWMNLGQVRFRLGDMEGALESVAMAVEHRGEWLEPLYQHSWLLLQQENLHDDDHVQIVARENQLLRAEQPYWQALGKLLRAERYVRLKSKRIAQLRVQDCLDFAREHRLAEIYATALQLLEAEEQANEGASAPDSESPQSSPVLETKNLSIKP